MPPTVTERPNILWICTDQQRFDTIAALGNPDLRTPHLDRLAADGVAFTHAFCQSPICTPSRASFLTGFYPSSIRACGNGNDHWADAQPLVTARLSASGYRCGLAGKLHLSRCHDRCEQRPLCDGYDDFAWSHHPMPSPSWPNTAHDYQAWLSERGVDWASSYQGPQTPGWAGRPYWPGIAAEHHQTTWCAERAINFISQNHDRPWLMSVNPFDPHAPFDPPREYLTRYHADDLPGPKFRDSDLQTQARLSSIEFQTDARRPESFDARGIKAAYYAMIELIDAQVGRLLQALESTGQSANTVVVFMSDHGEMLGDHGLLLKGCRFYEGLVRVPLIISWPGHFLRGARCPDLVELTDVTATLFELAGLPGSDGLAGRTLLPILTGQQATGLHRDRVRCEYYSALAPDGERLHGERATMLRTERFKIVTYHGHGCGELYDLQHDPDEFENLWQAPAWQQTKLDLLLASFDQTAAAIDLGPAQTGAY